jgi:hypothetical protein
VTDVIRPHLLAVAAALALLAACAPAALAAGRDVLDDCTDDEVMSRTYTQKEYRDALSQLAADADQYGNCRQVIRRAQLRAAAAAAAAGGRRGGGSTSGSDRGAAATGSGGGGTTGGGGAGAIGSAPAADQLDAATPAERRAVEDARTAAGRPFELDNARVDPDKVGAVPGVSQVSDLPAPLAAVLAVLLAAALAVAALRIRSLVNARRA